jgi:hypothetical protein
MPNTKVYFQQLIDDHSDRSGFCMPLTLSDYLSTLLDSRLTRTDIIPGSSFAETYLQLYTRARPNDYVDFADSTLFFCSLLPEYGHRRGLDMHYYAALGISTYYTAGDLFKDPRFTELGNWFYLLQRFLHTMFDRDRGITIVDTVMQGGLKH